MDRCFQCGAVLTDAERVDVTPPRMSGWKKPWRNLLRRFRRPRGGPKKEEKPAGGTDWELYEFTNVLLAAVLSIVPGLGHVVRGQFRRVWWAVLIWVALIAAGIYLYGSTYGYWVIGVAIGLHAWIAVYWPDEEELRGFQRMGAMLAMMVVAAVLYNFVFHRVVDARFSWVHATFPVIAKNVHKEDVLLARVRFDPNDIQRGDIVVSDMAAFGHGERIIQNVISQVIGKPGDVVDVNEGRFRVNGKFLGARQYNFPHWLAGRRFSAVVPAGRFFLSAEYAIHAHGNVGVTDAMVLQSTVVDYRDVRGIVFMRWQPLGRRGFIAEQ
jgi:signal peptidase I